MFFVVALFIFLAVFVTATAKQAKKQQEAKLRLEQRKAEEAARVKREREAREADEAFRAQTNAGRIALREGDDPCHDDLYGERTPFESFRTIGAFGEGTDPCHEDGLLSKQPSGSIKGAEHFGEGNDPCHDGLYASRGTESVWENAHPEMNVFAETETETMREELLRAVVLSEVLGRPAGNRRRPG